MKFIAQELREPELNSEEMVRLRIPATVLSKNMVDQLKEALSNHPGAAPVYLHMLSENGEKVIRLGDDHRVEPRSLPLRRAARPAGGQGSPVRPPQGRTSRRTGPVFLIVCCALVLGA